MPKNSLLSCFGGKHVQGKNIFKTNAGRSNIIEDIEYHGHNSASTHRYRHDSSVAEFTSNRNTNITENMLNHSYGHNDIYRNHYSSRDNHLRINKVGSRSYTSQYINPRRSSNSSCDDTSKENLRIIKHGAHRSRASGYIHRYDRSSNSSSSDTSTENQRIIKKAGSRSYTSQHIHPRRHSLKASSSKILNHQLERIENLENSSDTFEYIRPCRRLSNSSLSNASNDKQLIVNVKSYCFPSGDQEEEYQSCDEEFN